VKQGKSFTTSKSVSKASNPPPSLLFSSHFLFIQCQIAFLLFVVPNFNLKIQILMDLYFWFTKSKQINKPEIPTFDCLFLIDSIFEIARR